MNNEENKQESAGNMKIYPWAFIGLGVSIIAIMFMSIPLVAGIIALMGLGLSVFGTITGISKKMPLRGVGIAGIVIGAIAIALSVLLIMENRKEQPDQKESIESQEEYSESDIEEGSSEEYYNEAEDEDYADSGETTHAEEIAETAIDISGASHDLTVGGTITLEATVVPEDAAEEIAWVSSNSSVAEVDSNGKVTAKGVGTAEITAILGDVVSQPYTIYVERGD